MALIFARAHWTDQPPAGMSQLAPPPPWAVSYPGVLPLMPFTASGGGQPVPPSWPSPPTGPVKVDARYHVWVPLVQHSDLELSGWAAGPNWAGPPPPQWPPAPGIPPGTLDEGYGKAGSQATGFQVASLRLFQETKPGTDFTYTVFSPSGTQLGSVTPTTSGFSSVITANVADGKGLWHIVIDRAAGSSVSEPALLGPPAGNSVHETYVSPYHSIFEGILGVEFTGQEIVVVTPTVVTGSASAGPCDDAGNRAPSDLVLNFAPPLPIGTAYSVVWTTGVSPPSQPQQGTVSSTPLASLSRSAQYPPGSYFPSATVSFTPPGGTAVTVTVSFGAAGTIVIAPCPAVCHDITLTTVPELPCVSTGQPVTTTTTATFSPSSPAFGGPVSWQVRTAAGVLLPLPAGPPTGPVLTYTFQQAGSHEITATIERPPGCAPKFVHDTDVVDVVACDCPGFVGDMTVSGNGCTFTFSAAVSNPTGAQLTYSWDFGNGPDASAPNAPTVTHTYPPGTTGQQTVVLTVSSTGCTTSLQRTTIVDCGGTGCPQFSGALAATSTGGCGFTFTASVTNPGGATTGYSWDFGDGTTTTTSTPSANHTYATAGTYTATLTMSSPGCDPATTTATVSCGATSPPPSLLCCFLIGLWGLLHLITGVLLYFGLWWASLGTGIAATIVLGLWIGLCCWPCALTFWRCCTLLQWQFVANSVLTTTLFGLLALGKPGNPFVVSSFALATTAIAVAIGANGCTLPNPVWPPSWPPCRCP